MLATTRRVDRSPRATLFAHDDRGRLLFVQVVVPKAELADDLPAPRVQRTTFGDGKVVVGPAREVHHGVGRIRERDECGLRKAVLVLAVLERRVVVCESQPALRG